MTQMVMRMAEAVSSWEGMRSRFSGSAAVTRGLEALVDAANSSNRDCASFIRLTMVDRFSARLRIAAGPLDRERNSLRHFLSWTYFHEVETSSQSASTGKLSIIVT